MKHIFFKLLLLCLATSALFSCSSDDDTVPQTAKTYDMSGFAKGADVSWLTQMEASGDKFYDKNGRETECMSLLRDMGVNAIRLRVWVNPTDGWCNKQDVLVKAIRAKNLGLRLMIDFHYSDTWADPGSQTTPAAWKDYDLDELKQAVADHTKDVLQTLKDHGIDSVEWVQVGNETRTGMLWPVGQVSDGNTKNFSQLVTAGYDAVKSVYPDAKVIVHIDGGNILSYYTWLFDGLKNDGAKWDVIGMSLYPDDTNWQQAVTDCLANMTTLNKRYGSKIMVCETGTSWDATYAKDFMTQLVTGARALDCCLGVFYWEPECYNGWNGYTKGTFDNSGRPTSALDVFGTK
ncbi:arabinogalactan endo-1,4-beta-galactosidase [Prevotella cerevisiae]|uniref:Arabinogalactan endo-beta-1,4-galactanase n=1 Tax=Segatella cerevisiae TaxID=2053716 RepID=A0ABT1BVU1_9BACT|nr:glycosyl hydrolase 53 family protein [Segatella cerevisiae]MCO6024542.1 arabinogalactan endo-1,4-beta-galactosidase [Segatella cerevisiae]